jgi:hypothetical protein
VLHFIDLSRGLNATDGSGFRVSTRYLLSGNHHSANLPGEVSAIGFFQSVRRIELGEIGFLLFLKLVIWILVPAGRDWIELSRSHGMKSQQ